MHVAHIRPVTLAAIIMALAVSPAQLAAQSHAHDASHGQATAVTPDAARLGGQAAFATIAEVVRLLDADRSTDWAKVDLERLRAHLADMDRVTLRAIVARDDIDGGARFTVRGDTGTVAAAARLARAHAPALLAEQGYRAAVETSGDGVLVTVTVASARDPRAVSRIRALGFVGLLATGDHHAAHHVAMARGDGTSEHAHD